MTVSSNSSYSGDNLCIVLLFYASLSLPVILGSGGFVFSQLLAIGLIVVLSAIFGRLIIRICRFNSEAFPSSLLEMLTGYLALSLLQLSLTTVFNIDAIVAGALSAGVGIAVLLMAILGRWTRYDNIQVHNETTPKSLWIELVAVALTSVLVSTWSREALRSVKLAEGNGVFRAWSDFFLQAAELRYLEIYPSLSGNSMYLSGTPQVFYHRASYAVASLFSALSSTPALESTMYFWMPTGMILLGVGAYLLGFSLGGRGAGLLSVAMLYFMPDPAMYWKNNALFSFHWLIQVAPGTGYALAAVLAGFALFVHGFREDKFRLIAVGFVFIVASAAFRMHVAIPAMISYWLLMLFVWRPGKPWLRIMTFLGCLIITVLLVLIFEQIPFAPHFISGKSDGLQYIKIILGVLPAGYAGFQQAWTSMSDGFFKGFIGYLAILPLELGIFFPVLLISLIALKKPQASVKLWAVPVLLIAIHYLITIYMPTPMNGDISEWSHRSFPLLYTVVVVFTSSFAWSFFPGKLDTSAQSHNYKPVEIILIIFIVSALMYVPWHFGKNIQKGFIGDGKSATSSKISSEIFTVSRFIRDNSAPGDVFVFSGGDPFAVMVSLTGRQAYISREDFFNKVGGKNSEIVKTRISEIRTISTLEDMVNFGSKNSVRWFVLQRADNAALFDKIANYSELLANEVSVFDLTKLRTVGNHV